jgi:hypothetical protein
VNGTAQSYGTAQDVPLVFQASFPLDADTWQVAVVALDTINSASRSFLVTPYVICT